MARDRKYASPIFFPTLVAHEPGLWQPSIDVYRTEDGWLLKADLAGVRPEDVTVVVDRSRLVVRGQRRDCTHEAGCRHYRMEISYARFERSVELPDDLAGARVDTEFRDGMLLVRVRKEGAR
jgi:HSP20 family protein